MRRTIAALLILLMSVSLTACSSGSGGLSLFPGSNGPVKEDDLIYPEDDKALGYLGDTLRTSFFDMRIDEAYTCYEYDGVTPEDGNKLLVAKIYMYNHTSRTQPMYFMDFKLWWDEEDDAEDWSYEGYVKHLPLFTEEELEDGSFEYYTVSEKQLPTEYDLSIRETKEGILLYQVPEESSTYSIFFDEYFADETEGASFQVLFSAPLAE